MTSGDGAVFPRADNSLLDILGGEDPTNAIFRHNTYGQGVNYHSKAFDEATEIVGEPELRLWLTCDAPDADLAVLLYEVLEDGSVNSLSSDQLRLRYRNGSPAAPGCAAHSAGRFRRRAGAYRQRSRSLLRLTAQPHSSRGGRRMR